MIKWKASFVERMSIESVSIEKETNKSVWFGEERHNKITADTKFYDTHAEAKIAVLKAGEIRVAAALHEFNRQEKELCRLRSL